MYNKFTINSFNIDSKQAGFFSTVIAPVIRHEYITLMEKAHRDAVPFWEFIAQQTLESTKDMMRLLQILFPKIDE